ncbi:MAG: SPOR domain-containing protein [Candidatus Cloacimonetes bacterium]|nr:SPOR domain-containing protein [Candidatus Cloacimonadota bacterium]MCF7813779.1 SPOR domain-containing protein [Candidatus Cloacimonadota bacterium]MCF7868349.1 SPOR domain-containing protein [Candidatus Cloacimonadota bacterium]MCF7883823.1 SPOR domain-containing protein [Candidatus Cloacimonadota bacterium]
MRSGIFIAVCLLFCSQIFCAKSALETKYKKAIDQQDRKKFEPELLDLATSCKDSLYGQFALLDLAKLNLLDRNYAEAVSYLKEIYSPLIEDKQYWLAKAYLKNEQYQLAIISAQIYIADSEDFHKVESAFFLMTEAYLMKGNYKKAYETLEELRVSKYISDNIPLLYFKLGNCQELLSDFTSALVYYKKLKQEFPYHQYSYMAEERIYKLKNEDKIDIDLSAFSSYLLVDPNKKPPDQNQNENKLYLQVGAFSSRQNANKLGSKIKTIGYSYSVFTKIKNSKKLNVVMVGPFPDETKLTSAMKKLEKNGIKSFLVKKYD